MWRQGEHVLIVGQSGSGKTTLARDLLRLRGYVVMLVSKQDDLIWSGYKLISQVKDIDLKRGTRYRLRPVYARQASEFWEAMEMAYTEGGWTVYLDEMYYAKHLGLEPEAIKLLTQGRSQRVTAVVGLQRPSWVTRFAFSETVHYFSFRLGDRRDVLAMRDITGNADYAEVLPSLKPYEYAYLDTRAGQVRLGTRETLEDILGRQPAGRPERG